MQSAPTTQGTAPRLQSQGRTRSLRAGGSLVSAAGHTSAGHGFVVDGPQAQGARKDYSPGAVAKAAFMMQHPGTPASARKWGSSAKPISGTPRNPPLSPRTPASEGIAPFFGSQPASPMTTGGPGFTSPRTPHFHQQQQGGPTPFQQAMAQRALGASHRPPALDAVPRNTEIAAPSVVLAEPPFAQQVQQRVAEATSGPRGSSLAASVLSPKANWGRLLDELPPELAAALSSAMGGVASLDSFSAALPDYTRTELHAVTTRVGALLRAQRQALVRTAACAKAELTASRGIAADLATQLASAASPFNATSPTGLMSALHTTGGTSPMLGATATAWAEGPPLTGSASGASVSGGDHVKTLSTYLHRAVHHAVHSCVVLSRALEGLVLRDTGDAAAPLRVLAWDTRRLHDVTVPLETLLDPTVASIAKVVLDGGTAASVHTVPPTPDAPHQHRALLAVPIPVAEGQRPHVLVLVGRESTQRPRVREATVLPVSARDITAGAGDLFRNAGESSAGPPEVFTAVDDARAHFTADQVGFFLGQLPGIAARAMEADSDPSPEDSVPRPVVSSQDEATAAADSSPAGSPAGKPGVDVDAATEPPSTSVSPARALERTAEGKVELSTSPRGPSSEPSEGMGARRSTSNTLVAAAMLGSVPVPSLAHLQAETRAWSERALPAAVEVASSKPRRHVVRCRHEDPVRDHLPEALRRLPRRGLKAADLIRDVTEYVAQLEAEADSRQELTERAVAGAGEAATRLHDAEAELHTTRRALDEVRRSCEHAMRRAVGDGDTAQRASPAYPRPDQDSVPLLALSVSPPASAHVSPQPRRPGTSGFASTAAPPATPAICAPRTARDTAQRQRSTTRDPAGVIARLVASPPSGPPPPSAPRRPSDAQAPSCPDSGMDPAASGAGRSSRSLSMDGGVPKRWSRSVRRSVVPGDFVIARDPDV